MPFERLRILSKLYDNVKHITRNGKVYTEGDTMVLSTFRGNATGVFEQFLPRNHKYPVIAKVFGKSYKFPTRSVIG